MPPTLKAEIGFATSPLGTETRVEITDRVRTSDAVTVRRGRSYELDQAQAGTASLVLNDPDRDFDPDNTNSPYYPNVTSMQRLYLSGVYAGATEAFYTGFITQFNQRFDVAGNRVVDIAATDAVGTYLGLVQLDNDPITYTMAATGIRYIGGTATSDIDGALTIYQIDSKNGLATGGTFTLSFRGYSATLPFDTTGQDVKDALEAFPIIGPDTVMMSAFALAMELDNTSDLMTIQLAGPYIGVDVTDLTLTSNVTPAGPTTNYTISYTLRPGGAPPGYWPNPLGRHVRITVGSTPVADIGIRIHGIVTPGEIYIEENLTITSAVLTVTSTNTFYKILQIFVSTFNAGNIGKVLTIDFLATTATLSSDQFDDMLDVIAWPTADRDIQTGKATLTTVVPTGGTALSYLAQLVEAENGTMYIDREGKVVFRNRHERIIASAVATLSNRSPDLPYKAIATSYTDRYLYNDVRVTRSGGTEQIAQDSISTGRYLTRSLSKSGLLLTSDTEAATFAKFLLRIYKDPHTRIESLDMKGEALPDTLWPLLLTAELGDRYAIMYYPPDSTADADPAIDVEVHIESMEWSIQDGVWRVRWSSLAPGISGFWVLGRSRLGRDTRLGF